MSQIKIVWNCGRKRAYKSRKEAMSQKIARELAGQKVRIYKHDQCGRWHTTSRT